MPRFAGVWLINRSFGDDDDIRTHYVPNDPGVIKSMEARDWEQSDLPDLDDDDPEFIEALEKLKADAKPAKSKKTVEAKPAKEEEEGSE